ncbi:hypothetical protein HDZ31DRAFT_85425 [Schizophyllum fasciatum]
MPPTDVISSDDFRQIFSDALTSFSPLATLVGADSARAFAHEVTNKKQTVFATLAPIGALGMMATVCKASDLPGVKDLLGAGDTDILDAAADVGCYVLFGLVPRMSKRGGLTCKGREVNRGIAACAIVTLDWDMGANAIDFDSMRTFLQEFSAATVTGRVEWTCGDLGDLIAKVRDVRQKITHSLDKGQSPFDSDSQMSVYEELEKMQGGHGYVELHWPSPSLPLETRPYILYVYTSAFLLIFFVVAVFTASPLIKWQSPQASALLLGGQLVLSLGQTLTHVIIKRLRTSKTVKVPTRAIVPEWQLVDNTWFTSALARRSLAPSTFDGYVHLGQHHRFSRTLVFRWEALLTLLLLVVGFLAFYIGAKSSDVRTVIIFIFLWPTPAIFTPLKNFGWTTLDSSSEDHSRSRSRWPWKRSASSDDGPPSNASSPRRGTTPEEEALVTDGQNDSVTGQPNDYNEAIGSSKPHLEKTNTVRTEDLEVSEKAASSIASVHRQPIWDMPKEALNPMLIPLPPSRRTSPVNSPRASVVSSSRSRPASSRVQHRDLSIRQRSFSSLKSVGGRVYGDTLHVNTSTPGPGLSFTPEYRLYTKIAVRNIESIGMFYFGRAEEWSMAAHVVHSVVRRYLGDLGWQHPVGKEPVCEIDFEIVRSPESEGKSPRIVHGLLLILVDALRSEDLFWYTGQEICAIIMNCFSDARHLPSENPMATETWILCEWVYIVRGQPVTTYGNSPPFS